MSTSYRTSQGMFSTRSRRIAADAARRVRSCRRAAHRRRVGARARSSRLRVRIVVPGTRRQGSSLESHAAAQCSAHRSSPATDAGRAALATDRRRHRRLDTGLLPRAARPLEQQFMARQVDDRQRIAGRKIATPRQHGEAGRPATHTGAGKRPGPVQRWHPPALVGRLPHDRPRTAAEIAASDANVLTRRRATHKVGSSSTLSRTARSRRPGGARRTRRSATSPVPGRDGTPGTMLNWVQGQVIASSWCSTNQPQSAAETRAAGRAC